MRFINKKNWIKIFAKIGIIVFTFHAQAQEYSPRHQMKVNRNGYTETHSNPNYRIKLDYFDQAVDIEINRWATMGKTSQQVVTHLRKVTFNIVASTASGGPETRVPNGSLGNLVSATTNIPVSMACNNDTDPTSKSFIHEMDHVLAVAFGLSYWQNVGPGHQAGGTWNGYNINGTVMQPFSPSPAYQAYCIDTPVPAQNLKMNGRILDNNSRGLRGVYVKLNRCASSTNCQDNDVKISLTSTFGYFNFQNLNQGTYVLTLTNKRYRFDLRNIGEAGSTEDSARFQLNNDMVVPDIKALGD